MWNLKVSLLLHTKVENLIFMLINIKKFRLFFLWGIQLWILETVCASNAA